MIGYMPANRASSAARASARVTACAAGLLALGPLSAAVVNSVIVEYEIAQAAHLPVPVLLPAALDGMGGLALVALAFLRDEDVSHRWLWALVCASLGASMAANGAHAGLPLDARGLPELPWFGALGVAFVSPLSAAASAHLVLRIGSRVVELALREAPGPAAQRREHQPPSEPKPEPRRREQRALDRPDPRVIELARAGRGYRAVIRALGCTRSEAEEALRAARAHLAAAPEGAAA